VSNSYKHFDATNAKHTRPNLTPAVRHAFTYDGTGEGASAMQFAGQSVTSHVRQFCSLNEAAIRAAYVDANCRRPAFNVVVRSAAGCFIQGTLIAGLRQRLARIVVMTD